MTIRDRQHVAALLSVAFAAVSFFVIAKRNEVVRLRSEAPSYTAPAPTPQQSWDLTLPRILEQERNLKRTARPRDFDDHLQITLMRQLYVRNVWLRDTGGRSGKPQRDAELKRLTRQPDVKEDSVGTRLTDS